WRWLSSQAADIPAMPEPITAIRCRRVEDTEVNAMLSACPSGALSGWFVAGIRQQHRAGSGDLRADAARKAANARIRSYPWAGACPATTARHGEARRG